MVTGMLRKMAIQNKGTETSIIADYCLKLDGGEVPLNSFIGNQLNIRFLGNIYCVKCGRKTSKSFGQGFCYPCFISAPETEDCVLRPELCRAHEGIARDIEYANQHCLIDHFVYLAWSGGLKVGITRHHQIPTRWLDQGATKTIIVCRTPNRYRAGEVEVELKKIFADKTNWQAMLKGVRNDDLQLVSEKAKALEFIEGKEFKFRIEEDIEYDIEYPVIDYPTKVKSMSFDKDAIIQGKLVGIKGQYLIFDEGRVINIRNYGGYQVEIN